MQYHIKRLCIEVVENQGFIKPLAITTEYCSGIPMAFEEMKK